MELEDAVNWLDMELEGAVHNKFSATDFKGDGDWHQVGPGRGGGKGRGLRADGRRGHGQERWAGGGSRGPAGGGSGGCGGCPGG